MIRTINIKACKSKRITFAVNPVWLRTLNIFSQDNKIYNISKFIRFSIEEKMQKDNIESYNASLKRAIAEKQKGLIKVKKRKVYTYTFSNEPEIPPKPQIDLTNSV